MTAEPAPTLPPSSPTIPVVAAGEGPVARSVVEALHSVVSPAVASVVIESALAVAGRNALPEEPESANAFIRGPLLDTLRTTLDHDGAQAFLDRMEPILNLASLAPPPRSRFRVRTPERASPLVVFASLDPTHAAEVSSNLGPLARVETASNVLDLLIRIDTTQGGEGAIVVVDGAMPPIDPVALASMLPSDRPALTVVLWRVPRKQRADIDATRPQNQSWLAFGEQATLRDLTDLLQERL